MGLKRGDQMAAKIPVGATIARTYGFAFGNFFTNLGAVWIPFALLMASSYFLMPHYISAFAHMPHLPSTRPGAAPDIAAAQAVLRADMKVVGAAAPYLLTALAIGLVSAAAMFAALTREALGLRKGSVLLVFPFGAACWRLLGAYLLLALVFIGLYLGLALTGVILGVIIAVLGGVIGGAVAAASAIAVVLAVLVAVAAFIFVSVRLSFFVPAIVVAERRISLGRSWELTRGNFWRIVGIVLSVLIPLVVIELLVIVFLFDHQILPPLHAGVTPHEIEAWSANMRGLSERMAERQHQVWYIYYPAYLVFGVVLYGLFAALPAFAYRALVSDGPASLK